MRELHDKVVFVTGGASGIGLGIAKALVAAGPKVVLADLRADHIEAALAWFDSQQQGARVHAIRLDVTDRAAMAAAADETARVFGEVNILVNNAGVGIQVPFEGVTYEDWDFGLGVNLGGVINGLQTFLPRMRAHGQEGHIVNTSSLSTMVPMPAQFVIYVAAKAAITAISEVLQPELAPARIGVSVLLPGPVDTNIHEIVKNRPAQFQLGPAFDAAARAGGTKIEFPSSLNPDDVGRRTVEGIRNNELYIVTHGEWREQIRARQDALLAALPTQLDPTLLAMITGAAQPNTP